VHSQESEATFPSEHGRRVVEMADDRDADASVAAPKRSQGRVRSLLRLSSLPSEAIVVLALVLVGLLHLSGLLLFTRGFLLNRVALPSRSSCADASTDCTLPSRHPRAVVLVFDALRWDFLFPQGPDSDPYHHNRLLTPARLTHEQPSNSLLFKFIADPPTTTLQRLKGLTTGTLPTFVDAGSNFGGSTIEEDNWLEQARSSGKRIVFAGDDTWLSVFPSEMFEAAWPYDSFNVEDLDTVDRGIESRIFPLLEDESKDTDWDVLIAHFLGLDHAGHRFGPSHPQTARKLDEIETVLRRVVATLRDDDLLLVFGDHGMDSKGDHGGDSPDEVEAGLWIYSKAGLLPPRTPPFSSPAHPLAKLFTSMPEAISTHSNSSVRSVPQISLVPTLSLLLGLPIPFNNLGPIIPEIFLDDDEGSPTLFGKSQSSQLDNVLRAARINAAQVYKYLVEYTQEGGPDLAQYVPELVEQYESAQSLRSSPTDAIHAYMEFMWTTLERTRRVWAKFDLNLMLVGLAILAGSLPVLWRLFTLASVEGSLGDEGVLRQAVGLGTFGAFVGAAVGGSVAALTERSASHGILAGASLICELCLLIAPGTNDVRTKTPFGSDVFLGFFLPFAHAVIFGSNSFVVWEDKIVLSLLALPFVVYLVRSVSFPEAQLRKRTRYFSGLALICIRLIGLSTVCREEQHPYCTTTFYSGAGSSSAPLLLRYLTIPTAIVLPYVVGRFLDISKSKQGLASLWLDVMWRTWLLAGASFWLLDSMPLLKTFLARVVLVTVLLACSLVWRATPLCIEVSRRTGGGDGKEAATPQVVIVGFANSFGSVYLLFVTGVFALLWLVMQPTGQVVLALGLVVVLCFLEILDSQNDADALRAAFRSTGNPEAIAGLDESQTPSQRSLSTLALVGYALFFATGHQAVISTIQWKAAFVGLQTVVYPLSPLLVILNTLGPFIFTATCAPLLVFWKTTPTMGANSNMPTLRNLLIVGLGFVNHHAVVALCSAVFAAYFRRHLMVWKIFAPRFMLAAVALLAVDVVIASWAVAWAGLGTLSKITRTYGTRWS
jgi:phosphatidylinositol glycan class O